MVKVELRERNIDEGIRRVIATTKSLEHMREKLNGARFEIIPLINTTLKMKIWNALVGKELNETEIELKQREHKIYSEKGK